MLFYSSEKREAFLAGAASYAYNKEVNELLNADLAKFDLKPELPKFRMPTLVANGRYDINVTPSVGWKIHKAIPGSKFVVFEKSGHLPWYEEPETFQKVIEDFLNGK
jgi:proline iminopeptidase